MQNKEGLRNALRKIENGKANKKELEINIDKTEYLTLQDEMVGLEIQYGKGIKYKATVKHLAFEN